MNIRNTAQDTWLQVEVEFEKSAVRSSYIDYLITTGCLQVFSKDEALKALNMPWLNLEKEFYWGAQGIDPSEAYLDEVTPTGTLQIKTECIVADKNTGKEKFRKYCNPYKKIIDAVVLPMKQFSCFFDAVKEIGHLCITEGVKKTAMLQSFDIPCISICGVTNWRPTSPKGERPILSAIYEFLQENPFITVHLLFDSDVYTNGDIARELTHLRAHLKELGVDPLPNTWRNRKQKGIDDLIASIKHADWGTEFNKRLDMIHKVLDTEIASGYIEAWEEKYLNGNSEEGLEAGKSVDSETIAEELLNEYKTVYKFHHEQGTWRKWNEQYWEAVNQDLFECIVRKSVKVKGHHLGKSGRVTDIAKWLKYDLTQAKWTTFPRTRYIAFSDCIYDILERKSLPHQPGYGFTSCLEREYKRIDVIEGESIEELLGKYCPVFYYSYLEQMNSDVTKVLKLVAVINAMLTYRCYPLQFFLQLQGKPGSGKSTFTRLLSAIVGSSNAVAASLADMSSDYHKARMVSAQLVLCTDENKSGNHEALKKFTGGDLISFRPIFGHPGCDYFYGLLVIVNNNPLFVGDTTGLDRRVCLIKFDKSLANADSSIETAMMDELDALISIALMMDEASVRSLIKAKNANDKLDQWLNKVDGCAVAHFMEECITPTSLDHFEQNAGCEFAMFEQFCEFAIQHKHQPMKSNSFIRKLHGHLDVLGWEYKDSPKKRANGSKHPVPVTYGVAMKHLYECYPDTAISERLAECADINEECAGMSADTCADIKPLQNKECADSADINRTLGSITREQNKVTQTLQLSLMEENNSAAIEPLPGKIPAQPAQPLQNGDFLPAHIPAPISAHTGQIPAQLTIGSKVSKIDEQGRKLHGWIGYIRKMLGSRVKVWWEGEYDRKPKTNVVIKNPDGTPREKLTQEKLDFLIPIE